MELKVNGEVIVSPSTFEPTIIDLDNGESTNRGADGTLNRDRIVVKRQINMAWGVLSNDEISSLLQAMSDVFFEFRYPDPMEGNYVTKTFYVGNRPCPALLEQDGKMLWNGLKITLIER